MFVCPKSTTHLHKFQQGDRLYVADLSQCLVLEIDNITLGDPGPMSIFFK